MEEQETREALSRGGAEEEYYFSHCSKLEDARNLEIKNPVPLGYQLKMLKSNLCL
jgi:hypothetical protein